MQELSGRVLRAILEQREHHILVSLRGVANFAYQICSLSSLRSSLTSPDLNGGDSFRKILIGIKGQNFS